MFPKDNDKKPSRWDVRRKRGDSATGQLSRKTTLYELRNYNRPKRDKM
jgi:hypothetical protein